MNATSNPPLVKGGGKADPESAGKEKPGQDHQDALVPQDEAAIKPQAEVTYERDLDAVEDSANRAQR